MINVTRARFEQIFKPNNYKKVERRLQIGVWRSMTEYDIFDISTNTIVGYCTDTSWENTYQIIEDLCTAEDFAHHYSRECRFLTQELDRYKRSAKQRAEYKALSLWGKIKYHYKKWKEKRYRKKYPRLIELMEDTNVVAYDPEDSKFDMDTMIGLLGDFWMDGKDKI